MEIALRACWRWDCPADLLEPAQAKMDAFMRASHFEIEKTGKVEGRKMLKRIEVRHVVEHLAWEGDSLFFSTRLQAGEAPSPLKLLGGILGVAPDQIQGLTRLKVVLGQDPRLEQSEKYEPKLHNIYEDAVLLEGPGNLEFIDDDDDGLLLNR